MLTAVSYIYWTSGACNGSAATRTGTSQGTKEHIRLTRAEYRRIRRQPRGGDRTSASYHSSSNPCPPPEAARRPARAPGLARAGGRAATCLLSQGGTSETRTRASSRKPARAPRRPRAASPPRGWREGRGRGARCPSGAWWGSGGCNRTRAGAGAGGLERVLHTLFASGPGARAVLLIAAGGTRGIHWKAGGSAEDACDLAGAGKRQARGI